MSRQHRPGTHSEGGARSTTADPLGTPGKQTLVEQAYGGIVQRRAAGADPDPAAVHAAAARGTATPSAALPHRQTIQQLFGRHDISSVRAHTGPEATASAHEMGAEAYATGDHVVLGGDASLHTAAHEAAHVVQQRAGVQLKGGVGAVGDPYEQHADAVADRVVRGESAEGLLDSATGDRGASGGAPTSAIQRAAITPATDFGATRADHDVKANTNGANELRGFGTAVNGGTWHTRVVFDPLVTPGLQGTTQLAPEGSGVTAIIGPDHPYGSQPGSASAQQNNLAAATLRGGTPHVAAHILNDQLGGPGESQNLFAFPSTANTLMETQVESKMKAAVQEGHYIHYRGQVHHPAQGPADQITMSWNKLDTNGADIGGGQNNVVIPFGSPATNQAVVAQTAGAVAGTALQHPSNPTIIKAMPWGPFQMPDPKNQNEMEAWLDFRQFPAVGSVNAFAAWLSNNKGKPTQLAMLPQTVGDAIYQRFGTWLGTESNITIRPRAGRGVTQAQVSDLRTAAAAQQRQAFIDVIGGSEHDKVVQYAAQLLQESARTTARGRI